MLNLFTTNIDSTTICIIQPTISKYAIIALHATMIITNIIIITLIHDILNNGIHLHLSYDSLISKCIE